MLTDTEQISTRRSAAAALGCRNPMTAKELRRIGQLPPAAHLARYPIAFSDARSSTKRYFTSPFSRRS